MPEPNPTEPAPSRACAECGAPQDERQEILRRVRRPCAQPAPLAGPACAPPARAGRVRGPTRDLRRLRSHGGPRPRARTRAPARRGSHNQPRARSGAGPARHHAGARSHQHHSGTRPFSPADHTGPQARRAGASPACAVNVVVAIPHPEHAYASPDPSLAQEQPARPLALAPPLRPRVAQARRPALLSKAPRPVFGREDRRARELGRSRRGRQGQHGVDHGRPPRRARQAGCGPRDRGERLPELLGDRHPDRDARLLRLDLLDRPEQPARNRTGGRRLEARGQQERRREGPAHQPQGRHRAAAVPARVDNEAAAGQAARRGVRISLLP